jgi:hypothetical protein
MSLFSFNDTTADTLKLVWRFDSAGISATAFFTSQPTEIIYYHFQPYRLSADNTEYVHKYTQLINLTTTILTTMAKQFLEYVQRQPDAIDIVFGEPWSHVSVRHISYKRKTNFKLTNAFLSELVTRDLKNIKQRGVTVAPDHNFSEPVYHRISIAGHPVYTITGQTVNDIRLDYTVGNLNNDISTVVTKLISERFHVLKRNTKIHHYQDLLIKFFAQSDNLTGCIVDISGHITDVYVFQNGIVKQWGTVPSGALSMVETIARRMNINLPEFSTLLKLYRKDLLSDDMRGTIKNAFKKSITPWIVDMQKFLADAVTDGMIIDQVFWMGSSSDPLLSLFVQSIQSDTIAFPQIFGTHQVGSTYIGTLFSLFSQYEDIKNQISEDQDIIINLAL